MLNTDERWEKREGASYPLGVHYVENEAAYNFAIYSKHATRVTLNFYGEADYATPLYSYELDYRFHKSNRIWHIRIKAAELQQANYYAYKIDGPEPDNYLAWHVFDKDKVLLDPYARSVFFPPDFSRIASSVAGANDGKAPLGVLIKHNINFDWQNDHHPWHENDLIIYELHVRGFTFHPGSGLTDEKRGTYAGLTEKISYLKELGITAVELMPVQQFDGHTGNYWGYSTLNFFSPHHEYASSRNAIGQLNEFKELVRELHKADIEVILDVVYNHTTEDGLTGPVYSFKGIDNSTYYLMNENASEPYLNYSGTGNTLHTKNSYVRRMILDSLRYWRKEMHVDGFRFDLASVFCRNTDGSIAMDEPAIFEAIASDPFLANARFIAEPWDAAGIDQLGKKFPGLQWMQWNGAFRDDVRKFIKGDEGMTGNLIARIYGSDDLFSDDLVNAYHPYQSINYITSHDGFTLYDLVSYNQKHNELNGHNNIDGTDYNWSWNCGTEGEARANQDITQLRKKQVKNFCVLLFISNGTPMFVAGDEFLRSQLGNNNPYNQDNEISWIDWELKNKHEDIFTFFKKMIAFRKSHSSLSRSRFWRNDVKWYGANGALDTAGYVKTLAFYLNGKAEKDNDFYVMINSHWEAIEFKIMQRGKWFRVIDTSMIPPDDFKEHSKVLTETETYIVGPRSVVVMMS
jgi:isoamylase